MDMVHFQFEGLALQETCWLNGNPYFTRRAIGEWLEAEHPQKYIDKLVERNPHIKTFSVPVKLAATDGKKYTTEVYDPIGLQLLINKSDLPKAIQFQIAAAHLVYDYMKGKLKPSKWTQQGDLLSASRQILSLPQGRKRAALVKDLAEREGVDISTAYRRIELATGQRLKTTKGHPIRRSDKGSSKYPDEKQAVRVYLQKNPDSQKAEIKRELNLKVSTSTVKRWIREIKKTQDQ